MKNKGWVKNEFRIDGFGCKQNYPSSVMEVNSIESGWKRIGIDALN